MAHAINAAKARLKKNQLAVGIGVRLVRNVDIIKVMKAAGFDWLFLDLEHGVMSIETAAEICVAAQDSGIAPIVRVPYGAALRYVIFLVGTRSRPSVSASVSGRLCGSTKPMTRSSPLETRRCASDSSDQPARA